MHREETVELARSLRMGGMPIKEVAARAGVSVGWASVNLKDIQVERVAGRAFLEASADEWLRDREENSFDRETDLRRISSHRIESRWRVIEALIEGSRGLAERPKKGEEAYVTLDNLQGLIANEPKSWVLALIGERCPALLRHLVAWRARRRRGHTEETMNGFGPKVEELKGFLLEKKRAPSEASTDSVERNLAHFVARWKAIAVGRGERKASADKAESLMPVFKLIDGLRSRYPGERRSAQEQLTVGGLAYVFSECESLIVDAGKVDEVDDCEFGKGRVKRMGRKQTTGRYETREELERMVRSWYAQRGKSMDMVARICGVSTSVVQKILSEKASGVGGE